MIGAAKFLIKFYQARSLHILSSCAQNRQGTVARRMRSRRRIDLKPPNTLFNVLDWGINMEIVKTCFLNFIVYRILFGFLACAIVC